MKEKKRKTKTNLKFYLLFIILFLIFWMKTYFGSLDVDKIIFSLFAGVVGAESELIMYFIRDFILFFIPIFTIFSLIKRMKYKPSFSIKIFKLNFDLFIVDTKFWNNVGTLLLILSFSYFIYFFNIISFINSYFQVSTIYEEYYVNPDNVEIVFPEKKRNLIYIILESMETGYSEYEIGSYKANLIPNLKSIAENNSYFSNTDDFGGGLNLPLTNWTAASIVAQTSGVPLDIQVVTNLFNKEDSYIPYITTIGDILEKEGYNQMFMLGSDASYGGRGEYFASHGNYEIWDYQKAIEKNRISYGYYVWWGFEDSKLFEYAEEELTRLSVQEKPFNFTMLTANTHFFEGYTEEDCENTYESTYANSIVCSDSQVGKFINWIQNQDFYENTTIVLTGDHLSMNELFYSDQNITEERTIYNAFVNSAVQDSVYYNREFSVIDLFPTTLASIGAQIKGNRLGLGTNLYSEEPTLIEKLGKKYLEEEIYKKSKYYAKNFIYDNQSLLSN